MKMNFFIVLLIGVLFFYNNILIYNKIIVENIVFSFIPSILLILILVNLILEFDALSYLYNKIYKNKVGRIIYVILLIIICCCLGMPTMQLLLLDLKNKKILSQKNVDNFIYSFGTVSFSFLYGVCLSNLKNKNIAVLILIIYFIICFIFFLLFGFKINNNEIEINKNITNKSLSNVFFNSLKTIGIISCSVILFNMFLFIFETFSFPFNYLVEGLIEFSYPMVKISKINNLFSYILLIFISLFPSLSLIVQSKILNENLNLKKYLFFRLLISLSGVILFIFIFKLFNNNFWY